MEHAIDARPGDSSSSSELRRDGGRSPRTAWIIASGVIGLAAAWLALDTKEPLPAFRTTELERRTIVKVVEATGTLDVRSRTEVSAEAPGALLETLVQVGSEVELGQALARLDDRAATIGLEVSRAALRSAVAREAEARAVRDATLEGLNLALRLNARGLAATNEVAQARSNAERALAVLGSVRAERHGAAQNLKAAELARGQRTVVAPRAGVVLQAPAVIGAIVAPERGPLFVIGTSLDRLRIDAWISESDVGEVRVGQTASFTVPAYAERSFTARLESLSIDASHVGTRVRYLARLDAPNEGLGLLPGMTATLRIEVGRAADVLAVREAALRFAPAGSADAPARSRVYRLDASGQVQPVNVQAGMSDGTYTEIQAGLNKALKVGDALIVGRFAPNDTTARGPGITLGRR